MGSGHSGGAFRLGAGLVTGAPSLHEILISLEGSPDQGRGRQECALAAVLGAADAALLSLFAQAELPKERL